MIPRRYIEEWKQTVSWIDNNQVEQDLIISRALVAIYSDSFLMENLAFRGGTALHKLYANPASRYSEDIDLVQIKPGPIGDVITQLRKALSFIEGFHSRSESPLRDSEPFSCFHKPIGYFVLMPASFHFHCFSILTFSIRWP